MNNPLHLDEGLEREIGIVFTDVRHNAIDDLRLSVQKVANLLCTDPIDILTPERGFLVAPLTKEQRTWINRTLGAAYANENAAQQKDLLLIPIEECGDPMVNLEQKVKSDSVDISFSEGEFEPVSSQKKRIWWMRKLAAMRLFQACSAFNRIGILPHLEDAFRPEEVQRGLFIRRIIRTTQIHPEWSDAEVMAFSKSITAPMPALAGHQAGAAVDLRLRSMETKSFLPLGNEYAEGGVISNINCPYVTQEQFHTRMLFASVMRMAGFKLLPTENWHASSGDRGMGIDAPAPWTKAIYGPIRSFDEKGNVVPYEKGDVTRSYVSDRQASSFMALARERAGKGFLYSEHELVSMCRELIKTDDWSTFESVTAALSRESSPVEEDRDD